MARSRSALRGNASAARRAGLEVISYRGLLRSRRSRAALPPETSYCRARFWRSCRSGRLRRWRGRGGAGDGVDVGVVGRGQGPDRRISREGGAMVRQELGRVESGGGGEAE